ncbi:MAG: translation initiation factor IF-2, partial [Zestosphaera sp.]
MGEETKKLRSPIVTVLGHVDHGKCLHPSEKVLLADGRAVEISSLAKDSLPSRRIGDYEVFVRKIPVLSLDLRGFVGSALTESVWRIRYRGPLFKIVLSDGRFVRVTPEHPFLTHRGWVRADKIEKHDMIAVPDLAVTGDDFSCSGGCLGGKVVLRSREILFKEVRSVGVEDYEGFLYDLSVPETQSFIANGVVVHNTTLLDKIRGTTVVSKEPGEMTQHVGASLVPASVIEKIVAPLKNIFAIKLTIPGLLFIDTPGHEAFSNLRRRGGSVADFAILVIDIMEGVKKQTLESVEILMSRKVPFVVAANKIDRIHGWRSLQDTPFTISVKNQSKQALEELDKRIYALVGQLSQANIPSERYDRVRDFRKTIAIVPISAKSGEGLAELLAVLAGIVQRFLTHRIMFTWGPAKGVVLEVKEIPGLGHCADVIIYDGILRRGDIVVLGGYEGPVTTRVRALLMPRPLEEMRVVGEAGFTNVDEVVAAAGVRLSAPEIEKVVAGAPLQAVESEKEIEEVSRRIAEELMQVRFSKNIIGVVVKADTLGTLEAVVSMLESRGIPVRLADVGPLTRREVIEASIVAKENKYLGVILLFNVKIPPDIEELALREGVKIFR